MFVARFAENEFIMDINHLEGLDNVEYGSEKYANKNQNTVKNRIRGGTRSQTPMASDSRMHY